MATKTKNEEQLTTFNTRLSKAADSYAELFRTLQRAKTNIDLGEAELLEAMKEENMDSISIPYTKGSMLVVRYSFTDAKEKLSAREKEL